MNIEELQGSLALIGMIAGATSLIIFGFIKLLNNSLNKSLKPLVQKIDKLDEKMMSRESSQTILSMQTREIVGLKRKVMPTINAMKTFLSSIGVKVKPKTGEYIGDLSSLYKLKAEEFEMKMKKILEDGNEYDF